MYFADPISAVSKNEMPQAFFMLSPSTFKIFSDFPGGSVVKNLPANAGDIGSIPGLGRSHMLWGYSAYVLEPMLHEKPSHCN